MKVDPLRLELPHLSSAECPLKNRMEEYQPFIAVNFTLGKLDQIKLNSYVFFAIVQIRVVDVLVVKSHKLDKYRPSTSLNRFEPV